MIGFENEKIAIKSHYWPTPGICYLNANSVNDVDGQMIMIALRALNESNVDASDLTSDKCEVAIVELNTYTLKSAAEVTTLLTNL